MTIKGPDPDKGAYRFGINREVTRWRTDLRPRWVTAMDEVSAREIDAEFENCLDPNNMDDATHAKDTLAFLKRHLDQLEHALKTREQLQANQAKFHELIAKRDLPGPEEAMQRARANIEVSAGQGLDPKRLMESGLTEAQLDDVNAWRYHPLFDEVDGVTVMMFDPSVGFFMGQPAIKARFESADFKGVATWVPDPYQNSYDPLGDSLRERHGQGVPVQLRLSRTEGLAVWPGHQQQLKYIELSRVAPGLLHTNFSELTIKVPKALPEGDLGDLTDEDRADAQARLEHAQRLAGIYRGELDDRDVREVLTADEQRGAQTAQKTKEQAKAADYVKQWSDKPISEPGKAAPTEAAVPEAARQEVLAALKLLYEATGLEIETLALGENVVHVRFVGQDKPLTTKLPEPLSKLLEAKE